MFYATHVVCSRKLVTGRNENEAELTIIKMYVGSMKTIPKGF